MNTDIAIAQAAKLKPISEVAASIGIHDIEPYGKYKAKLNDSVNECLRSTNGKLVLVTAINPTPAGEGKTTVTIGLSQALNKLGVSSVVALREPSLGPCMGVKGGATGGGYSQVVPMEDINLHFTGDFHAITTANNLLSAVIDNHIHQGNELRLDPRSITFTRVLDMNDRALRQVVVSLGGKANGFPREDGFQITVASEVMAILCLSETLTELKERLGKIVVGYNLDGEAVTAAQLGCHGAMAALLRDAFKPNLVQTLEGTPAIIHGGPFANIAHGCNSVRATKLALRLCDVTVTEAGFGADLGAEKFFDIKCRASGLRPDAVVLVATVRALKYNGGVPKTNLTAEDLPALEKGFRNLEKHVENLKRFGVNIVVALNAFVSDTQAELDYIGSQCKRLGVRFALAKVWEKGGEGGVELAQNVLEAIQEESQFKFLYDINDSIEEKIKTVATQVYGASQVVFTKEAKTQLSRIKKSGYDKLPVCMAKTQYSLSDNPSLLGRPEGFTVTVSQLRLSAGAGFVVALMGDIMTMPGLPKVPAAMNIDINQQGDIVGLF